MSLSTPLQFATKTIETEGKRIKAQIWDTAGQERCESGQLCCSSAAFHLVTLHLGSSTFSLPRLLPAFPLQTEQSQRHTTVVPWARW